MSIHADAEAALRAALAAWRKGDATESLIRCREAIAMNPDHGTAWTLLGIIQRKGDPHEAESALRRAADLDPRNPEVPFHLGNLYREQGRFAAAVEAYERALVLAPGQASVLNNLGLARDADGDAAGAQSAYRAVLAWDPHHPQALANLAHLLCRLRQYEEALLLCAAHLQRWGASDVDVLVDHGICLLWTHDHARAEACFRQALALAPDDPAILINLGTLLVERSEFEQAEAILARAAAGSGKPLYATSLLAHCRQHLCAWDGLDRLHEHVLSAVERGTDELVNAFGALSTPMSAAAQLQVARRWARDLVPPVTPASPPRDAARRDGKLRLGYVSSDFGTHPIGFLLAEVWDRHDRARFETFAYSIGPRESSPLRARIEAAFTTFVDCSEMATSAIEERIRADGVEVLIDLNGYTTNARSDLFAKRPAPVQLSWLGYLGTLGAPWYDGVISDRVATPPDMQSVFTERLLHLPDCMYPSDTRREIAAEAPDRSACSLPAAGFVFCCFNNQYKILPRQFDVWMRILREVPASVLWLSPANPTASANLRREATARGVDSERIVFAPRVPLPVHLARHVHADLFLDTLPYNAGTTANDALFMGVPIVTAAGATMAGRVAASQLHAIGLSELVASDMAGYEALALALARDPKRLADCRRRLASNRRTHPLFDMHRFVAGLEDLLLGQRPSGAAASARVAQDHA